jgi:hypothetical protein
VKEKKSSREAALEELRREWDRRLASLRAPGASDRLRAAFAEPIRLQGRVKAGEL